MTRFSFPFATFLAALAAGCAPSLELPPPPDIDQQLQAFSQPDAVVVPQIMATAAGDIEELRNDLEGSSFYEEILDVIVQVQDELYNDEGEVDLGGVTFATPNGAVTVDYICDGWDGATTPDEANGTMALNMRLSTGSIDPLVWGSLEDCRYPLQIRDQQLEAVYNGEIVVYFGDPLGADEDPFTIDVTFVASGTVRVEDVEFRIDDLFNVSFIQVGDQIRLNRLDLLIELADGTSFVYSFFADATQEVRDAVGTFSCSLEERECNSPSGTFSW